MIRYKLKELRIERGFSQKQLAENLNVSSKTISHWESGYSEPPVQMVILIKKFFDVSYEDLLE